MQIGIIGLGRMGGNIARRLMRAGHHPIVFDQQPAPVQQLVEAGAAGAADLASLVAQLQPPRAVWVMLPAGEVTGHTIETLSGLLEPGDIVIDGGNSYYRDDISRAAMLREKGLFHVDAGTSGGVWGLDRGYCLMIGGDKAIVDHLEPIFAALAPGAGDIAKTPGRKDGQAEQGYLHCGPNGAGHFVKMIHNGIEYGLMQAYAEGFHILKESASDVRPEAERYDLSLPDIAEVWRRGSVIGSWLLDLTADAFASDPELKGFGGFVQDSGEGRWTVEAAVELAVPAPVLTESLFARFRSRLDHNFADKMLSAMRHGFGGHVEPKSGG
jgi:6-phosphogluconate dehydrogenase